MPASRLKLAIHGASGRIGRILLELIEQDDRFDCVAALVRSGSPLCGQAVGPGSALRFSDQWPDQIDVLIDFSLPDALNGLLDQMRRHPCAMVSGTTGLNTEQFALLEEFSRRQPLLWASNFSLGAAVLTELAVLARRWLPPEFEVAIFEAHHSAKRDAPSGTALTLAEAVDQVDPRGMPAVCSSLRAGRIVGEHTVFFAGPAERIELTHRAHDRSLFARGALDAAAWLSAQPAGRYVMRDLLPLER